MILPTNPYGGVDVHLHLAALSSLYKSFNHDVLCNLDNPQACKQHASMATCMVDQLCYCNMTVPLIILSSIVIMKLKLTLKYQHNDYIYYEDPDMIEVSDEPLILRCKGET